MKVEDGEEREVVFSAVLVLAMAGVFGAFVAGSLKRGIVYFQMSDKSSSRKKITRGDNPISFWLWTVPLIGAAFFMTGIALAMLTDSAGLTDFFGPVTARGSIAAVE